MKVIHDCKTCENKDICKYRHDRELAIDFLESAQWRDGRMLYNVVGLNITITCSFLDLRHANEKEHPLPDARDQA